MTGTSLTWHEPEPPDLGLHRRRVAFVISSLGGGGAERVLSTLANLWADAGHDVSVVTMGSRNTDVYELSPRVRRSALDLVVPSAHAAQGLARGARRVAALRRALRTVNPHVVVSFGSSTNVVTILAAAGMRQAVFVSERTDPRFAEARIPWSALRRLLYPMATGVIVQTDSVASWARRFCPRVHVIPNPVKLPARSAEAGRDHGPRRLIAMGRLKPEKGFDLLIQAFARIASSNPDWALTILGEGAERRELEALVARLRLQSRISLPGRESDPLPQLLSAQAFVLSSRLEGFPNALIEAMACGLPPVAFDCPSGPGEIISHERSGLLVPAGDVAALAAALARVLQSAAERARMGQNARDFARTVLAPDRVLQRWNALLGEGSSADGLAP